MHPGLHAQTTPDKPAVIMAGSGEVVTYRELDERSNRLAQLCGPPGCGRATTSPSSPRTTPASSRCSGRRCAAGSTSRPSTATCRPTRRRTSSTTAAPRRSSPPTPWPTWPPSSPPASPTARCGSCGTARSPASTPTRTRRRAPGRAARRPAAGRDHALLLGHDRAAEGHQAPAVGRRRRRGPAARRRCCSGLFGIGRRHRLPLARAALPRRAAGLHHRHAGPRRHGGGDGALRPGRGARAHRAPPRHPQPVGADDVRPHAEAAGGRPDRATTCRPTGWPSTPPRPARSRSSGR